MSVRSTSRLDAGSEPSLDEYINASNEAYNQPGVPPTPFDSKYPPDLMPLQTKVNGKLQDVFQYDKADGFYGVAFKTPENAVVIAYEGTNLFTKNAQFTAGQVVDDADIVAGQLPPAFPDAVAFEKTVAGIVQNRPNLQGVYLTGHSLGAAEAEYVSAKTGLYGTTFGTPGISTKTPGLGGASFAKGHLTNYVEIGDPVGNSAIESDGPINDIVKSTSPNNLHFGTTKFIGYLNPTSIAAYGSLVAADGFYTGGTETDVGLSAAALAAAVPDHFLTEYAYDLNAPLGGADHSYGANPLCFVGGTRIRLAGGFDVAVEQLAVGDLVATASGAIRPIRWLGHRTLHLADHECAQPVRVTADAFGHGIPERDVMLSPGHPVLIGATEEGEGGCLVPIMCLINGTSVARLAVDEVTYWHVELAEHDILLAEGLPAESYVDLGSRPWFAGANGALLDPDLPTPGVPGRCRPVAIDGPIVEAERRRLDGILARRLTTACAWPAEQAGTWLADTAP